MLQKELRWRDRRTSFQCDFIKLNVHLLGTPNKGGKDSVELNKSQKNMIAHHFPVTLIVALALILTSLRIISSESICSGFFINAINAVPKHYF